MYLVYLDDSADKQFAVMCAVIVQENYLCLTEGQMIYLIDEVVPEGQKETFEFHARDLFHGIKPFDQIDYARRMALLERFLWIATDGTRDPIRVVYGAVDQKKLRSGLYSSSQPIDVTFRCCLNGIQQWFAEESEIADRADVVAESGLLICDDTTNKNQKRTLQATYHARRGRADLDSFGSLAEYLHDDIYFGDSAYSIGIQMADVAAFLIRRHLSGKMETEPLYDLVKPAIYYAQVEPPSSSPSSDDEQVVLIEHDKQLQNEE